MKHFKRLMVVGSVASILQVVAWQGEQCPGVHLVDLARNQTFHRQTSPAEFCLTEAFL